MKVLSPTEAASVNTFFSPSGLKPKLDALEVNAALLISKKEWKHKTAPRQLVHEMMGAGKFSVFLTEDKKSWKITRLS